MKYGSKIKGKLKAVYRTIVSFIDVFNHYNVIADRINNAVLTDIDAMQFAMLPF